MYLGLFYDANNIPGARERLVSATNEEIADAFVQGFLRYAERPNIPKKEAIIESWLANSIPYAHILLSLSVFLDKVRGMNISEKALPDCIAAVASSLGFGNKVTGYDETLSLMDDSGNPQKSDCRKFRSQGNVDFRSGKE